MECQIVSFLKSASAYATHQGIETRKLIIDVLQNLVDRWITEEKVAQVCPFGSYRLGVFNDSSDMDIMILCPIVRKNKESFFTTFKSELEQCRYVTSIVSVTNTFVPLIKIEIIGIEIDLIFIGINLPHCPEITVDSLTGLVNPEDVSAFNGLKNAMIILNHVPNKDVFITALKFIKHWSDSRGISGNALGYIAGITWAICVAIVCKICPTSDASIVVRNFYRMMTSWPWPKPMYISETGTSDPVEWKSSRNELMPILTPAKPCINTTYKICPSTFRIIMDELNIANKIVSSGSYSQICLPIDFYNKYKTYLVVTISAGNIADFKSWHGYVKSKLMEFINHVNIYSKGVYPHLFPKSKMTADGTRYFIGLHFKMDEIETVDESGKKTVDLVKACSDFQKIVNNAENFKRNDKMIVSIECVKKKDLLKF